MKKFLFLILIVLAFSLIACKSENCTVKNEDQIKLAVENEFRNLIDSAQRIDIDSILSNYSENVTAIEQGHMHKTSLDFINSYREAVATVKVVNKISIETKRINVLSPEVVLYEVKLNQDLQLKSGENILAVNYLSLVYKLINSKWKIIHHHGSFPSE